MKPLTGLKFMLNPLAAQICPDQECRRTHMFTIRSEDYINGWRLPTEETERHRTFKFG